MDRSRKLRAAIGLTFLVAGFWTTGAVLLGLALGFVLGGVPMVEMASWVLEATPTFVAVGLCLGAAYAAGLALLGPGRKRQTLTGRRSSVVGLLGGAVAFVFTAPMLGLPTMGSIWSTLMIPLLSFAVVGGFTGLAVWGVANRGQLREAPDAPRMIDP
jgi:hypothetical protein